jgi:hypothetical protein
LSSDNTFVPRSTGGFDDSDRVIVSARVFADAPPPGPLPTEGVKQGKSGDGKWFASFRIRTLEAHDSIERQRIFETALAQLRETFADAGIDVEFARARHAEVELDISLVPKSGQAGIVFTSGVLAEWDGLNLSIHVDALAG